MSRPIDYLESAVSDRPHSQMDRLLFEDEMSQQPQHFMRAYQEGYDPAKAIAEGDFMPMGAGVKLYRGVPKWYRGQMVKGGKHVSPSTLSGTSTKGVYATPKKQYAIEYANTNNPLIGRNLGLQTALKIQSDKGIKKGGGYLLEFDVPEKWYSIMDASRYFNPTIPRSLKEYFIPGGIPKEYLKKVHKGYQEGGPAERPPLLGYMNPAVQDETADSQMNRIMFENELKQQPQYSMGIQQEVYDPAQAWGEGMMPIGGMAKLVKHGTSKGKKILDFIKSDLKKNTKRLSMEAKEHANQIKNIKKDIKETQSWWTKKGKPSFKTAEEVRNQMELVEKYPVHFMKKGVKGVQYPKKTPEYKLFMDRMRHTARNLEMKNKMKSFADYKFTESSLLKNRNDFLIKAINDYKKTGMVRPSVEKTISQYSKGLERLPKSTGPSLNDILKSLPENPF